MKYGVIGEHLTHSFSKEIHSKITNYDYQIREIAPADLPGFMKQADFNAINVTIPYKQDVIPFLSYIHPQAEAIHAVNTIVNREGKLYGYNTDYFGLSALISKNGITLQNQKVLILGTGGTSLTARAIAKDAGAAQVLRASRTPKENDQVSYEDVLTHHTDATVLINTTPCGMFPKSDAMPIDPAVFPNLTGVIDAIYNPLCSRLILKAKELGLPAEGGLYMLVAQGAKAVEHFLDTTLPEDTVNRVFQELWAEKQNIVLTGMPGCGKTTVGKLLARRFNRPFVDMDDLIVEQIGCPISEYFEKHGEAAFRDVETKVAKEIIAPKNGMIIATGGGAILRSENVTALKGNGKLYFIDRPLEQLIPTTDRPTANSGEAIKKRYHERYDIYTSTCHTHIHSAGVPEQVMETIIKDFLP